MSDKVREQRNGFPFTHRHTRMILLCIYCIYVHAYIIYIHNVSMGLDVILGKSLHD